MELWLKTYSFLSLGLSQPISYICAAISLPVVTKKSALLSKSKIECMIYSPPENYSLKTN